MKYLIYGAGTIGITYGWLLSQKHTVDIFVKPERYEKLSQGIDISIKDLRKRSQCYEKHMFYPHCITQITDTYDGILIAVNRCQLSEALPHLALLKSKTKYFAFMQNNWNLESEIQPYISCDNYLVAFPSSIGGGCENNKVEVIVFDEPTRIGGKCLIGLTDLQSSLEQAGIKSQLDANIFDWLKIHYLQQSITAGAILEKGDYFAFAQDYFSIKKMVKAFREGITLCRYYGIPVNKVFPANLFRLPTAIVAHVMQKMFLEENTTEMVTNHMKKGLPEWIAGYKEVLKDGLQHNLPMTIWKSYDSAVEEYISVNR